ncbi:MAG: DNA-binding transcriptional regulator [Pseudomonadota bacterium]
MTTSYKNDLCASIHETAADLFEHGIIDKITMKEFDSSCLVPTETILPEEIRAIREREQLSQPVFARYLNVSKNLVSDWERGVKKPGGPALRLLALVKYKGLEVLSI